MWVGPTSGLTIYFFYVIGPRLKLKPSRVGSTKDPISHFILGWAETALAWAHMALTQPNDQVRYFAKCDSSHSARREVV